MANKSLNDLQHLLLKEHKVLCKQMSVREEMERVNWPTPNHTENPGAERAMPNPQPNIWTQTPTQLFRSVALSLIYYPLADEATTNLSTKKTFYTPTKCLWASPTFHNVGLLLRRKWTLLTPALPWLCHSLSQNTSVVPVASQSDFKLIFMSFKVNHFSMSNCPHSSLHSFISNFAVFSLSKKTYHEPSEQTQTLLLDPNTIKKRKLALTKGWWSEPHALLDTQHLGNWVPFQKGCYKRENRWPFRQIPVQEMDK